MHKFFQKQCEIYESEKISGCGGELFSDEFYDWEKGKWMSEDNWKNHIYDSIYLRNWEKWRRMTVHV